jgi:Domain of Unknown Function (DUF928).
MKKAMRTVAVLVLSALCFAQSTPKPENQAAQTSTTPAKDTGTAPKKLERVHANLQGFELAPRQQNVGTQIGGATRGIGTSTTLLAPHKGQAYTLKPLFQWANSNTNIKSYAFKLLAEDGNTVLFQSSVSGTSLKYPVDAPALKPGEDYFWTVQPAMAMLGEAAEPAEMVILGAPQRAEMESQLATYPANSPERAQFFVDKRLWYDSIESYTELLSKNPDDIDLLELRAELYEQLPQTKNAADADLERARKSRP